VTRIGKDFFILLNMRSFPKKVITNHEIDITHANRLNYLHIVGKPRLFFNHMAVSAMHSLRPLLHPPENEQILLAQAQNLAGYTLGELAALAGLPIPPDLKRDKGWIGILLELWLGASAGSKPEQDFAALGIELKTIPIDSRGRPLETTFVCVAPLTGNTGVVWETSHVRHKLKRVLWIPVEGERQIPLAERRVGSPLLWEPSEEEDRQLRLDWEELMDLIVLGQVERITARHGEVLQLRPKAANSKALTEAIGLDGSRILTLPRGFYLKKNFTSALLARHFQL
jgi:DNA mismatch repair protein MutH